MKEITLEAKTENLDKVLAEVDSVLEENDCPLKLQMQIDVAVEEIFVNIANYAYTPEIGEATLRMEVVGDPKKFVITFMDRGIPYNPLGKEDPDVTLSVEERKIGGLGIYMVKKSMDQLYYSHTDGMNVFSMEKHL